MIKHLEFFLLLCLLLFTIACSQKTPIVRDAGAFPWLPPKPSAYCRVPTEFLLKANGTTFLSDVLNKLEEALEKAGYNQREIGALKNGFAIASRIEQYRVDGSPETGFKRWQSEISPLPLSTPFTNFQEYLKALFYPERYCFRRIVFIVKPGEVNEKETPITPDEAKKLFSEKIRTNQLKDVLNTPYPSDYTCTALIYEFEKHKINEELIPIDISNLPGKIHLEKSNLWHELEQK